MGEWALRGGCPEGVFMNALGIASGDFRTINPGESKKPFSLNIFAT